MPLRVEFVDRPEGGEETSTRWTVGQPGERVLVRVLWSVPRGIEAPESERLEIGALSYWPGAPADPSGGSTASRRFTLIRGAEAGAEAHAWSCELMLRTPRFFPLAAKFAVAPPGSPGESVQAWVVPRPSAWVSLALVVGFLLYAAYALALTLATLRLTVTNAVTGLSGLTILALARKLVGDMINTLRPFGVPMLGITYLIHRALLAVLVGGVALWALLNLAMTEVVNQTGVDLTLILPGRERADQLAPDEHLTFVGGVGSLRATINGRFAAEGGRFAAELDAEADGARGPFDPPLLALRCGRRAWSFAEAASDLALVPATLGEDLAGRLALREGRPLTRASSLRSLWQRATTDECRYEAGEIEVERRLSPAASARYRVRYPWHERELERLAQISARPQVVPVRLIVDAPAPTATGDEQPAEATGATLWAELSSAPLAIDAEPIPAPIPAAATARQVTLQIAPIGEDLPPVAELTCQRHAPSARPFHVEALQATLDAGDGEVLRQIISEGSGWSSTWRSRARSSGAQRPWACREAEWKIDQIRVQVSFKDSDFANSRLPPLSLDFDEATAPRKIRIEYDLDDDGDFELAGTLTCEFHGAARQVRVGALWATSWANPRPELVSELALVAASGGAWSSLWQREPTAQAADTSRMPPWGCWPVWSNDEGVDERRFRDLVRDQVEASMRLTAGGAAIKTPLRSFDHEGGVLRFANPTPHPCWYDRETGELWEDAAPDDWVAAPETATEKAMKGRRLEQLNRSRGLKCKILHVGVREERSK